MGERKEVILADVLQQKGYIRGPFGSALKRPEMKPEGIPVYEQQQAIYNTRDFRFFIDNEKFETLKRFQVKTNDLLISCSGTVGKVTIIKEEDPKGIISQALLILRADTGKILPEYLKYFFSSKKGYNAIISRSSGSVQVNLARREVIEQIPISLPLIEEQKKIVGVLKSIDNKIETNNQINRNLSEQLESVYISRFTTELNGTLADICEYTKARIDVQELTKETYYSTENMLPNKMGATVAAGLPTTGKTPMCTKGDVLISNIRPYFKKIVYCYETSGCSADVLCFVAKDKKASPYLYATLFVDKFFDFMVAGSKGTKMPRGDKQQIMQYPVHLPTEEELKDFGSFAENILQVINTNNKENARLQEIRDNLLPKLMSGELDVSEFEI